MTESFKEWCKEKYVDKIIKNLNSLSEQIKAKIENEKIVERERNERGRVKIELENQLTKAKAKEDAQALAQREKIVKAEIERKELAARLAQARSDLQAVAKAQSAAEAQLATMRHDDDSSDNDCVIS